MKKAISLVLCLVLLLSISTGLLAAEDKPGPAKEIQKQLDQGIAKGEQAAKNLVNAEVEKQVKSVGTSVEKEIKGKLPQAGSNVVYVVLAILAIGAVLSIMKKLIKLAVFIVILGLLIMWAKPMLLSLLSNVKF